MLRNLVGMALIVGIVASFAHGEERGKPPAKPTGEKNAGEKGKTEKPPGEKENAEKPGTEKPGSEKNPASKPPGGAWSEGKNKSPQPTGAEGAAAAKEANKNKQPSGAEGAAAGAAASNRNNPNASGAEGAAAGAAAANRNKPNATGAEGAAAGAAAANRNQPKASGAEGAAAGAAAANRNQPNVSGAEGAALGATAANRNQPAVSGAAGAAAGYASVRNSFDHPNVYNQQWYTDHPAAWTAPGVTGAAAWATPNQAVVTNHLGVPNSMPVSYGYGDNVTYQNGNVLIDGQNAGSAEAFSQQAADLALTGHNSRTTDNDEWLPVGVFALVRYEDQHPQLTLQLAVNKSGILRGNYTDLVTDHSLAIHGAVDKETQRAAWTIGDNKNFYMEAGMKNLTSGEAPALLHKFNRTERWILVRLPQPAQQN